MTNEIEWLMNEYNLYTATHLQSLISDLSQDRRDGELHPLDGIPSHLRK